MATEQGVVTITGPHITAGQIVVTPTTQPTEGFAVARQVSGVGWGTGAPATDTPIGVIPSGVNLILILPKKRVFVGMRVYWTSLSGTAIAPPIPWAAVPFIRSGPHQAVSGVVNLYSNKVNETTIANVTKTSQTCVAKAGQTGANASFTAFVGTPDFHLTVTGLTGMTLASEWYMLTFSGAATPGNNGQFLIIEFIDPTSVKVVNLNGFAPDANNGAISWQEDQMYTNPTLNPVAISAQAVGSRTVTGLTGMTPSSVGRNLSFTNFSDIDNNGTWEILTYISPTSVTVARGEFGTAPDSQEVGIRGWAEIIGFPTQDINVAGASASDVGGVLWRSANPNPEPMLFIQPFLVVGANILSPNTLRIQQTQLQIIGSTIPDPIPTSWKLYQKVVMRLPAAPLQGEEVWFKEISGTQVPYYGGIGTGQQAEVTTLAGAIFIEEYGDVVPENFANGLRFVASTVIPDGFASFGYKWNGTSGVQKWFLIGKKTTAHLSVNRVGITAAGTDQLGAAPVSVGSQSQVKSVARVTVILPTFDEAVRLPFAEIGMEIVLINAHPTAILVVFPYFQDNLGFGTNVATTQGPGVTNTYLAYDSGLWVKI